MERGVTMLCKYLIELRIPRCLAADRPMHPSVYELKVFCQKDHKECILYQSKEALSATSPAEASAANIATRGRRHSDDAVSF